MSSINKTTLKVNFARKKIQEKIKARNRRVIGVRGMKNTFGAPLRLTTEGISPSNREEGNEFRSKDQFGKREGWGVRFLGPKKCNAVISYPKREKSQWCLN